MLDVDDRRIRQLFESASQAEAAGRAPEAASFLRQAEAQAPGHPLVINLAARRLLQAGEPARAKALLDPAIKADPANPALWMTLAAALNRLGRADDELAALGKVLALEPHHFAALLQAASLHEARGDARTAAAVYRTALQAIPPGLPQSFRPALENAKAKVQANDVALETFLEDRLSAARARHGNQSLARFDKSLATLLRKRQVYRPQPSFLYVPELPAYEFYERSEFPWLDRIEAATDDIRAELMAVLAEGAEALEPYISVEGTPQDRWRHLNKSRRWGIFSLWKGGVAYPRNLARCPRTVAALDSWPRCELKDTAPTAVFSILDARTRIPPHVGVNNARLICHLPLIVPPGCGFRVGAEYREWEPGKAFVFDDTIEHEAWNDSDEPRAVLIFDIWNPYVSPAEREMITALTAGVGAFYGDLPSYIAGASV